MKIEKYWLLALLFITALNSWLVCSTCVLCNNAPALVTNNKELLFAFKLCIHNLSNSLTNLVVWWLVLIYNKHEHLRNSLHERYGCDWSVIYCKHTSCKKLWYWLTWRYELYEKIKMRLTTVDFVLGTFIRPAVFSTSLLIRNFQKSEGLWLCFFCIDKS